jgi:hypothetical protein
MNEQNPTTPLDSLINFLFDEIRQNALSRFAEIPMSTAALSRERQNHIGAAPNQPGIKRNGYANGSQAHSYQIAQ